MAIWLPEENGELAPDPPWSSEDLGDLPVMRINIPELAPLAAAGERLFCKGEPFDFQIVLLRQPEDGRWQEPMPLAEITALGAQFEHLTGSVSGNKIPVAIQVIEIHRAIAPGYADDIARYARRGVRAPKVSIAVKAVEESSGRVVSNVPLVGKLIQHRPLRRAWRMRFDDLQRYKQALRDSGFKPLHAVAGCVGGAVLGTGLTWLLVLLGADSPYLLGGALTLGPVIGGAISLLLSQVRSQAMKQTLAGGCGAYVVSLVAWQQLGGAWSIDLLIIGAVAIGGCILLGRVGNTVPARLARFDQELPPQ